MQNGYIDFKKNRAQYRADKGIDGDELDSREIESQIDQKDVEDEFVMLNVESKVGRGGDPNRIRKSHIVRQIEEGMLGVRNEDYDSNGNLQLDKLENRQQK